MTSPAQASSPPGAPRANPPASPRQQQHDPTPDDTPHEASDAQLPPLFTLVHNSSSRTTHHPHVHYIFADDDPEVLTRALAASDPSSGGAGPTRSVLLDLAPGEDGWGVTHAASLSPEWAVVEAGVRRMEDAEGQGGEGAGGLMLRIEGVEGDGGEGEDTREVREVKEEYGTLMDEFERRMVVLRRVVGAGEARRRVAVPGEGQGRRTEEEGEEKREGDRAEKMEDGGEKESEEKAEAGSKVED